MRLQSPLPLGLLLLSLLSSIPAHAQPASLPGTPPASSQLATDRWIELDLYWFDRDNIPGSVSTYLDRMYPVYKNANGWRGVIVNVGWMIDYVAGFGGNLDDPIPFPDFSKRGVGEETPPNFDSSPGTPPEKRRAYAPWTYRDLKRLGDEFRKQAAERYGMKDFKFGTFILGWGNIYDSADSGWRAEHPEVYVHHWRSAYNRSLIMGAMLQPDRRHYAAFPNGIPTDTPFYRFFARQWGSLSQATGIDALVLRDGMFGQVEYMEIGPYGRAGSANPADMERWNQWTASLVRETKQANPHCLVIGYSTASSAIGDWRVDGFDLEQIAREGYLDAWIDQSWGALWNDWCCSAIGGYTFQLSYILVHGAQLAGTHTKHYVLIDPWDAWEPDQPIQTNPQGIRWEIWAYTHAAVKNPEGETVPAGIYFSWGNRGDELWPPQDVSMLAKNADDSTADAARMREALGPTLVYNRDYLAWLNSEFPDVRMKESIDDHAAMLMKWQIPILSVTRIEWLPSVHSDLFVFQAPAKLKPEIANSILGLFNTGKPLAIISDPTWGIDPRLQEILSPPCKTLDYDSHLEKGEIMSTQPGITTGLSVHGMFNLWQARYSITEKPPGQIIYQTGSCPDLVVGESSGHHWVYWNPPTFSPAGGPLERLIENPQPYIMASRSLQKMLDDAQRSPFDPSDRVTRLLAFHWWRRDDGKIEFLVGNLDRDLQGEVESPKNLAFELPAALVPASTTGITIKELTGDGSVTATRDPNGRWKANLLIPRSSSSVWTIDEK